MASSPFCPALLHRRLFTFTRLNNKSLGGADLAMMASNVVLSALSVLPYEQVGGHNVSVGRCRLLVRCVLPCCELPGRRWHAGILSLECYALPLHPHGRTDGGTPPKATSYSLTDRLLKASIGSWRFTLRAAPAPILRPLACTAS